MCQKETWAGAAICADKLRYSINSSAGPDRGNGTVMPSALAVLRFRNSSTFVACWTVMSPGFSEELGEPPHLAFAIVFRSVFASSPTGFPRSTGAQGLVATLFAASDAYFYTRLVQLTHLASHHAIA